jgi:hypothetical protein
MDLLSFIIGIALGAAFSPFWISTWDRIKNLVQKPKTDQLPQVQPVEEKVEPAKPIKKPRKPKAEKQA